jgi:hypothetical protein
LLTHPLKHLLVILNKELLKSFMFEKISLLEEAMEHKKKPKRQSPKNSLNETFKKTIK